MSAKTKKRILLFLPYVLTALLATRLGIAWRMAEGTAFSARLLNCMASLPAVMRTPVPSFHPFDLAVGICTAMILWISVWIKGQSAKKFRHNQEYGSARWGTPADIEPYMDPKFRQNIILTQTERLTLNSRVSNPKYARNKNVLVVGGSGSGKTRFWLKPNLMQMHSSYVVTDPKGYNKLGRRKEASFTPAALTRNTSERRRKMIGSNTKICCIV